MLSRKGQNRSQYRNIGTTALQDGADSKRAQVKLFFRYTAQSDWYYRRFLI